MLASSLTQQPRPAAPLWATATNGAVRIEAEDDEDTYVCGGHFRFDDASAPVLLDVLPTLVLVRAGDPRRELVAHVGAQMAAESQTSAPGSTRTISQLARETGYESESAFSTAFRRVVGASPAHFRNAERHPAT